MGNAKKELDAILDQAEMLFGTLGRALHSRYMMLMAKQGGTGGLFENYESETGSRSDLPGIDELERDLGWVVDEAKFIKSEHVERMREGADISLPPDQQPPVDLSKPGSIGWPESRHEFGKERYVHFYDDGTWARGGHKHIQCNEIWGLYVNTHDTLPGCEGVDYTAIYRATMLRGLAEAHRVCAATRCERPLAWPMIAAWGCRDYGRPNVWCTMWMAVVCTAL